MPRTSSAVLLLLALLAGCTTSRVIQEIEIEGIDAVPVADTDGRATGLPAGAAEAEARLATSPRHAEWVTVRTGPNDSIRAWVVYPERSTPAPVVLVVHEIFGLSHWIRAVADQLAADGFIAIAPDLLSMKDVPVGDDGAPDAAAARAAIQTVDPDDVHRQLLALAAYGTRLPAATDEYGIVGFCWGGAASFEHAVRSPGLGASVVYYGTSPASERLSNVRAPVLGLYGEDDARVNATVPAADSTMRALGSTFEHRIYPGAGHGFLRAQDGREANLAAARLAWPETIAWFVRHLER
jgi:carboxymethylenebutenolidase